MFANNPDIRRTVPGLLEVYPVKNYGAIEIGVHEFCHTENGKPNCGTFKFAHVWRYADGRWTVARVVSYGHALVAPAPSSRTVRARSLRLRLCRVPTPPAAARCAARSPSDLVVRDTFAAERDK